MRADKDGRFERGDRTAIALVRAARAEFAERGFARTTVRDIAARAQVNPALVSYHFGGKLGLYNEVVDSALGALRKQLAAAVSTPGSVVEMAERIVLAYFDYLVENRDFPRFVQRGLLDKDERIRLVASAYIRPPVELLRKALGEDAWQRIEQSCLSLFGATLAAFLYEPLVSEVLGDDVLGDTALARRRKHLAELTRRVFAGPT